MSNQGRKYANRDEFLASVANANARELYVYLFDYVDSREGLNSNLGYKGFSVNVIKPHNPNANVIPLFWAWGNDVYYDSWSHCIMPQYKRMGNAGASVYAVDDYKSEINRLEFFTSSPDNPKWELTADSTKNQMQRLFAVIDKMIERMHKDLLSAISVI